MDAYGPLGVEVIMQDCHSCDPGSIPGAGASLISLMNRDRAADTAPYFDSINTWGCSGDVDARSTLALDNVAHGPSNHLMFMNSALVFLRKNEFISEHCLRR